MDEADDERLTRLFRDHADGLHRYAAQRLGADEARDVVSDAFVVAWRKLDAIPRDAERAWLFGVARNETLQRIKRRARGDALYQRLLEDGPEHEDDHADDVAGRLDVWRALAAVSASDRDVLLTTLWTELTPAEAAQVLGCSRTTYAVRLHRARRRLARVMAARSVPQVLITSLGELT